MKIRHAPRRQWGHGLQGVGVTDHLVQVVDDLAEFGPVVAVLLPAVQHELVQCAGTVHGWGQPVVLLNGIDDLRGDAQMSMGDGGGDGVTHMKKVLHELVLLDTNQIGFLCYFEGKCALPWPCCVTAHFILMDDAFASG